MPLEVYILDYLIWKLSSIIIKCLVGKDVEDLLHNNTFS